MAEKLFPPSVDKQNNIPSNNTGERKLWNTEAERYLTLKLQNMEREERTAALRLILAGFIPK